MDKSYSLLDDDLALIEIRKHKWIESEKRGYEVGFATAAVDWIRKYGKSWEEYRLGMKNLEDKLTEKRRHRRFSQRFPLQLLVNETHIACHTDDISLIGLACTIPQFIPHQTQTKVTILFQTKNSMLPQRRFHFATRITRVAKCPKSHKDAYYRLFLPFSEEIRDFIRFHVQHFSN